MTNQEFINAIAPSFQKWGKQYGYKIISAAIAQACLESGYGTSFKATFGHNILGLKYRPNRIDCNDGYFIDGGSEQNPDGSYTPLPSDTAWYNFKDWDACIHGYYQFINIPNYAKVKEATTPLAYLQAIKDAHYATSLNYVQNVFAVVVKWNLIQYDNIQSNENINIPSNNNINIIQKTNEHNTTLKPNRNIDWIVLHYTAGINSKQGTAQNTAHYFATTGNKASADFIVDDVEIVQYNPDPKNRICWAVGGNKYGDMATSLGGQYYGQCTNNNSISIEMCSRKVNTTTLNATDQDWYITNETINNAIILTKYLMQIYSVDINHVIMHHQVTGKWCPQPWCKNESALVNYYNFISAVKGSAVSIPTNITGNKPTIIDEGKDVNYLVKINVDELNVRTGPDASYDKVTSIRDKGIYTIVKESNEWGKLKSGAGWISLQYTSAADQSNASQPIPACPYTARVTAETLNIRQGPGANYPIVKTVSYGSVYTIMEEQNGFGRLKSGVGWVSLKYMQKT